MLAIPVAATAEVFTISGNLTEAWEPVFYDFPETGTGSAATGTISFLYDTDTNIATDFVVSIQGISVADLNPIATDRMHVHTPNSALRILEVGGLGFVDVPGGVEIVSNAQIAVFESLEPFLLAGTAWANVHTIAFPLGEIAGSVRGPKLVPFPPWSWAAATALVAVLGIFFLRGIREA